MTTATAIPCFICQQSLALRLARGRKSGKPSIMLICPTDGRHFRGFISDRAYVGQVLALLEDQTTSSEGQDEDDIGSAPGTRSKTNLEPGNDR